MNVRKTYYTQIGKNIEHLLPKEYICSKEDKTMTVKEIVSMYLFANGYDGLLNTRQDCTCNIHDLMPCGDISAEGYRDFTYCQSGYKVLQDDGDWLIKGEKP